MHIFPNLVTYIYIYVYIYVYIYIKYFKECYIFHKVVRCKIKHHVEYIELCGIYSTVYFVVVVGVKFHS